MIPVQRVGEAEGFEGAVAGLSLSDVIQLNGNNRFSGCITVQYGSSVGRIFFREGKMIHAEQGGRSGEDAFCEIMEWRSGRFTLDPNVTTTSQTIQKSTPFMLLEAHRLIDERRAGRDAPRPAPRPPAPAAAGSLVERLRAVPGVAYAVVAGKEGACVDDPSPDGEALAAKIAYLALFGNQLGGIFRAGMLWSAVIERAGAERHVLLLASKTQLLGVQVDAASDVHATEADVKKIVQRGA
jgi:predicted regulator of Ras-like GTPase activity (Roadblock/LC7/MglB family)